MVQCAAQMQQIGVALHTYASTNNDFFPWASVEILVATGVEYQIPWDDVLDRYLGGDLTDDEQKAPIAPRPKRVLECPADDVIRRTAVNRLTGPFLTRSYAMVRVPEAGAEHEHDLHFLGAGGQSGSGVTRHICAKRVWFRRPSETLVIVERPTSDNILGLGSTTPVADGPIFQVPSYFTAYRKSNHGSKWNYLFCDGHVAAYLLEETVRPKGDWYATISAHPANYMWTRNPND
jgi:prepilin-type processing-associated H-X9-DG protein